MKRHITVIPIPLRLATFSFKTPVCSYKYVVDQKSNFLITRFIDSGDNGGIVEHSFDVGFLDQ